MYETGHCSQCISSIIDCFHSFLDYIFEVNITNESLKKELRDNPAEYNAKDKTTWLFEMVAGKTLKRFLSENQESELYDMYKKFRTLRNKISHPNYSSTLEITYKDARQACKTVIYIIDLIKQKVLVDDSFNPFLFSLKHYFR